MNSLISTLLLSFLSFRLIAQSISINELKYGPDSSWKNTSAIKKMITDRSGNIYVTGEFEYNNPNPTSYFDQSIEGIFIEKTDSHGVTLWKDTLRQVSTSSLAIDSSGNVYLIGNGKVREHKGVHSNGFRGFVIKYKNNGIIESLWESNAIIHDGEFIGDGLYLTGARGDTYDVNGYQISSQGVIIKVNTENETLWAKGFGFGNQDGVNIASDSNKNGYYIIAYGFGSGNSIYKFDLHGDLLFRKDVSGIDNLTHLKADNSGNLYVLGNFFGGTSMDGHTLHSSSSYQQSFLAKLNISATFEWAVAPIDSFSFRALYLIGDSIFISGGDGYPFNNGHTFLSTYNSSGELLATRIMKFFPGNAENISCYSRTSTRNIFGYWRGHDIAGNGSICIETENLEGISPEKKGLNVLKVFPNPSSEVINIEFNGDYDLNDLCVLKNNFGQVLQTSSLYKGKAKFITSSYSPGTYYIVIQQKSNCFAQKVIVY